MGLPVLCCLYIFLWKYSSKFIGQRLTAGHRSWNDLQCLCVITNFRNCLVNIIIIIAVLVIANIIIIVILIIFSRLFSVVIITIIVSIISSSSTTFIIIVFIIMIIFITIIFIGTIVDIWLSSASQCPLQWRHNECDGVSHHQPHDCLLSLLFNKNIKLRLTGLCGGNSPVTGEFPAQGATNAEYVSIWWLHHVTELLLWPRAR